MSPGASLRHSTVSDAPAIHPMTLLGTETAILRDDRLLLTRREDFHVWCLPGGNVEPGEAPADGARREVREELGLEVELTRVHSTTDNWT